MKEALYTWLRRVSSGGMPSEHGEIVRNVVDDIGSEIYHESLIKALRAERDRLRDALRPFARPEFAGNPCGMTMWLLRTSQGEMCPTPIWSADFAKAIAALKETPR